MSEPSTSSPVARPHGARSRSGTSVIEFSLLVPWILFLFAALLDWGFYTNALIATRNAARAGVLSTSLSPNSAGDASAAWGAVLGEMKSMPNVNASSTCATAAASCSDGRSLTVSASSINGPDGNPASRVTVQYTTVALIPLPFLPGRLTLSQQIDARVIPE